MMPCSPAAKIDPHAPPPPLKLNSKTSFGSPKMSFLTFQVLSVKKNVPRGPILPISKMAAIRIIVHGHSHHDVHFGINSRNLAQGLAVINFVIFIGGGQKPSFIRGLICINSKWPAYDLPIITLSPITSIQITIDK